MTHISGKKCVLCNNSYSRTDTVRLFQFPVDGERRQIWKDICDMRDIQLTKTHCVCQIHFEPKYLGRKYLVKTAIPTLHIPVRIKDDPLQLEEGDFKKIIKVMGSDLFNCNLEYCDNCIKTEEKEYYNRQRYITILKRLKSQLKMEKANNLELRKRNGLLKLALCKERQISKRKQYN